MTELAGAAAVPVGEHLWREIEERELVGHFFVWLTEVTVLAGAAAVHVGVHLQRK